MRKYAISFNLDKNKVNQYYTNGTHISYAFKDIENILTQFKFEKYSNTFYVGEVNSVTSVLAVQKLQQQYPWFKLCVKDLILHRIEEQCDLSLVLK